MMAASSGMDLLTDPVVPPSSSTFSRTTRARHGRLCHGMTVIFRESKKPGVPARAAFDENLTPYKAEIPRLFWFNSRLLTSNGTDGMA